MFNRIEDKILKFIVVTILCLMVTGFGFYVIRFTPPLFKMFGVVINIVVIWIYVKYLRSQFSKKI
jgi:cytochrome b subunit of formate dehydrogenase